MRRHSVLLVLVCVLALPVYAAPVFVADAPVLLTSAGQSADFQIVKILFDRLKVPSTAKALAKPEDLKDVKTLVVAIGGSTKGLGAAGIDADEEVARIQALLARAKDARLKVLSMHIGGAARRGELSDRFIAAVLPKSDYLVVVSEGNTDGLFTKLSGQAKVSMETADRLTDVEAVLRRIFRVK